MPLSSDEIDRLLAEVSLKRDTAAFCEALMKVLRANKDEDFVTLEDRLRRLDLIQYLVANPDLYCPPECRVLSLDGKPRRFSMWVCMFGREEAARKLAEIGTADFEENRRNLAETGFMVLRDPNEMPRNSLRTERAN